MCRHTDGRGTATLTSELLDKPRAITRADAAATLLDVAESDRFAQTAVNVSGACPHETPQRSQLAIQWLPASTAI